MAEVRLTGGLFATERVDNLNLYFKGCKGGHLIGIVVSAAKNTSIYAKKFFEIIFDPAAITRLSQRFDFVSPPKCKTIKVRRPLIFSKIGIY